MILHDSIRIRKYINFTTLKSRLVSDYVVRKKKSERTQWFEKKHTNKASFSNNKSLYERNH